MKTRLCAIFPLISVAAFAVNSVPEYGAVKLKGPIGERLDLMFKHHVCATDVDYLTRPFREKTERRFWWQTEFWGKYMHAAVPFWTATGDEALGRQLAKGVKDLLSTQEENGYIGNYPDDLRCGEGWDVWGMKYTMMGLMHYHDGVKGEECAKALAAAARVCDYLIDQLGPNGKRGRRLYQSGNWSGYASSSVLEPVMWLYARTKEPKYLDFATYLVKDMVEAEDGPRLVDLALKGISVADRNGYGNKPESGGYVMKRNRWKAYEMMSCYQGLVEYWKATGRRDLLDAAIASANQIVRDEINVAGGCSCSEAWFHGAQKQHRPYLNLQETCVTTTWMRFAETLLTVTGEAKWADELEKTFYNIYLASMNRDGSEFAAYVPLNGYRYSGHHHCYMHTNCCNANGPRGFLAFMRALLQASGERAIMNFYVSGSSEIALGAGKVAFETYATYPRDGYVRIVNHTEGERDFTLALRIPAWSAKTSVKVNGKPVEGAVKPGGYFDLARTWKVGDWVEIGFDMTARLHELDHAYAITRGPIALARDSRFGDGALDEPLVAWFKPSTFTDVRPARVQDPDMWMTFTAELPLGGHHENPEGRIGASVKFCDYASAANLWRSDNHCRVWIPRLYGPKE